MRNYSKGGTGLYLHLIARRWRAVRATVFRKRVGHSAKPRPRPTATRYASPCRSRRGKDRLDPPPGGMHSRCQSWWPNRVWLRRFRFQRVHHSYPPNRRSQRLHSTSTPQAGPGLDHRHEEALRLVRSQRGLRPWVGSPSRRSGNPRRGDLAPRAPARVSRVLLVQPFCFTAPLFF